MKLPILALLGCLLSPLVVLADLQAGLDAYERRDYASALHEFEGLAETGDADGQHKLGDMYRKGKGVALDIVEAVYWYRLAAEQGHARAQNRLGLCYANGEGVEHDALEALLWHRQAAMQGLADAQNRVGLIYANGDGVVVDIVQAYAWYELAAAQGDVYALQNKDSIVPRMTASHSGQAKKLRAELCASIASCRATSN